MTEKLRISILACTENHIIFFTFLCKKKKTNYSQFFVTFNILNNMCISADDIKIRQLKREQDRKLKELEKEHKKKLQGNKK